MSLKRETTLGQPRRDDISQTPSISILITNTPRRFTLPIQSTTSEPAQPPPLFELESFQKSSCLAAVGSIHQATVSAPAVSARPLKQPISLLWSAADLIQHHPPFLHFFLPPSTSHNQVTRVQLKKPNSILGRALGLFHHAHLALRLCHLP